MNGDRKFQYHESTIEGRFEPLELVSRLVASRMFREYVVCEQDGTWCFGGDALGEVELEETLVMSRFESDERGDRWTENPLEGVREALQRMPIRDWNAYGWLGFEYAYLTGGREALAANQCILHMMIPRTEVRASADRIVIRSISRFMVEDARDLLLQPATVASYEPAPVDVHAGPVHLYREMVATAVEEIRRRGYESVELSRCVPVPFPVDMTGTYVQGRKASARAGSFVLELGPHKALGFGLRAIEIAHGEQPSEGWRALHAAFPRAAASGSPQQPAYDSISHLEHRARNLYAGAVLTVSSEGKVDAALVRPMLFEENGQVWLRAGATIDFHSEPARVYQETCEALQGIAPYVVCSHPEALAQPVCEAGAA